MNTIVIRGTEYGLESRLDEKRGNMMYILRGKRGAEYGLFRYRDKMTHMFVMNLALNGNILPLKGVIFTDMNGSLEIISM